MKKVSSTLKARRVELGYTQTQLAKELNVSQALVSKWEKEGGVPRDIKPKIEEVLKLNCDDTKLLGKGAGASEWSSFIQEVIDVVFEGEPSTVNDELNELGSWTILQPLKEAGLDLAKGPSGIELPLGEILEEYLVFYENISNILNTILVAQQIDDSDLEELWELQSSFSWGCILIQRSDLRDRQSEILGHFGVEVERFEESLTRAWLNAYRASRKDDSDIFPPNWTVAFVLGAGIDGLEEIPEIDVKTLLAKGEAPDPFVREGLVYHQVNASKLSMLETKIDRIMQHLGIE